MLPIPSLAVSTKILPSHVTNLTGRKIEFLEVLGPSDHRAKGGGIVWVCKCVCGNLHPASTRQLNKNTGSCGCKKGERIGNKTRKHGMTAARVWRIWRHMVERCHKPASKDYRRYGAKGVSVCARWQGEEGFQNFLTDMGNAGNDHKLSIDRRDNTKGYEPDNCRWATQTEQHRNRSNNTLITFNGKSQVLAAWAEETGIRRDTIMRRINSGWSIEKALKTPVHK